MLHKKFYIFFLVLIVINLVCFVFSYSENKTAGEGFIEGIEFYYKKDYVNAKKHFRKSIESDADFHSTVLSYFYLGRINIYEGNYDEAVGLLTKASEMAPNKKRTHFYLGVAYLYKGYLNKAKKEFETTLSLDPKLQGPHHYLGLIYLKENKMELALDEFKSELKNGENRKTLEIVKEIEKNENKIEFDLKKMWLECE